MLFYETIYRDTVCGTIGATVKILTVYKYDILSEKLLMYICIIH